MAQKEISSHCIVAFISVIPCYDNGPAPSPVTVSNNSIITEKTKQLVYEQNLHKPILSICSVRSPCGMAYGNICKQFNSQPNYRNNDRHCT